MNTIKILLNTRVIMAAKKLYYNKLLLKSNNKTKTVCKTKTVWNIVKSITDNGDSSNIFSMNIEDKISSNSLTIANAFNSYFSSVAENLLSKNVINKTNTNKIFFILLTTEYYSVVLEAEM
jgi:hypothetical protein